MSEWLDASSSSNKLKQSYFQDFIDVSGTVSLRNNKDLNLYNNDSTPEFSINSQEIRVRDNNIYYDISNSKFQYIKDLTENVQERLQDLTSRTRNISSDTTNIAFNSIIGDISMNGNVDIIGNLTAQYPIASIPPTAIQGVGTEEGNITVSVYTSDEIRFDDDEFVIVKEDKDKIQITPYGIFVSENVIYGDDDFALFKENHIPEIEHNLHLQQSLSVSGETVFDNIVKVPTLPVSTNTDQAASCAYVQSQNYIVSGTLMKQF